MEPQIGTSPAEITLSEKLNHVYNKVMPGHAIEIVTIIGLISSLLEMFRNCKSPEAAKAHVRRGSAVTHGQFVKAYLKEGHSRKEARLLATQAVAEAKNMTDEDFDAINDEVKDVPPSSFWPT